MKTTAILLALVATGSVLLAPAMAASGGGVDESAQKIDLRPAGGPMLYLACDHGTDLASASCGAVSLWQESNNYMLGRSLQKHDLAGAYVHDLRLTP